MTDKEIIFQLKKGNESYLKYLYMHLDMIKSWVKNNNGDEDDALDIFQESVIVFYKNLMSGNYESKSKISTYLFGICKRMWLNQLNRRLKYEKPSNTISESYNQTYDSGDVEFTFDQNDLKTYLENALNKLGEPCRSLLEKSIYLKLKMKELAEIFDYSNAHSARQQKLRCIKRLRSYISYETVIRLKYNG